MSNISNKVILNTIRKAVFDSMQSLYDPDYGLELNPSLKKRLMKAHKNNKFVTFDEIKAKYLRS